MIQSAALKLNDQNNATISTMIAAYTHRMWFGNNWRTKVMSNVQPEFLFANFCAERHISGRFQLLVCMGNVEQITVIHIQENVLETIVDEIRELQWIRSGSLTITSGSAGASAIR